MLYSYSAGVVSNYNKPEDYSGIAVGASAGYKGIGIAHSFNPFNEYLETTKATSMTFSSISESDGTINVDYFFEPVKVFSWG